MLYALVLTVCLMGGGLCADLCFDFATGLQHLDCVSRKVVVVVVVVSVLSEITLDVLPQF